MSDQNCPKHSTQQVWMHLQSPNCCQHKFPSWMHWCWIKQGKYPWILLIYYIDMLNYRRGLIFSTACLRSVCKKCRTSMTSSTGIWVQIQSTPPTYSCGGPSVNTNIHAYHVWHWITSLFQVCSYRVVFPNINLSSIGSYLRWCRACVQQRSDIAFSHSQPAVSSNNISLDVSQGLEQKGVCEIWRH